MRHKKVGDLPFNDSISSFFYIKNQPKYPEMIISNSILYSDDGDCFPIFCAGSPSIDESHSDGVSDRSAVPNNRPTVVCPFQLSQT